MDHGVAVVQSKDGTTIAFERSGQGPPLLLVHGAGADHTLWTPSLPFLQSHFTVYALDRRGHGASGDAASYAPIREIDDLLAVLNRINEPANLLGHSSGALLALEASRDARSLRRLVLYEPPVFVREGGRDQPRDLATRLAALLARGDRESAILTFFREGPGGSPQQIERLRQSPRWPALLAQAHTLTYDARIVGDYVFAPAALRAILVPILILQGERSPGWLVAGDRTLAQALPRARVASLSGQGHHAMLTAPEHFAETVSQFLTASASAVP